MGGFRTEELDAHKQNRQSKGRKIHIAAQSRTLGSGALLSPYATSQKESHWLSICKNLSNMQVVAEPCEKTNRSAKRLQGA
jgi:hypothetical protein